ncbi:MAG: efflux RND transporter periplasmic adaptor subunit [Candidatus Cloacimonetes bacterium]|nr:efflux RND transporter periplasmic adaptor subunit [Candidatus Cloacimonadota bacterium]
MQKNILLILLILSLMIISSGCDQDKKDEKKAVIPVMIYTASPDRIASYIKLTGGIEADTDLDLYSMASEKIRKITVSEGDKVKKGDLLLVQENEIFVQGVKLAEAGAASAQAQAELAEKEYHRTESLLAEGAVTRQQFDQTEMQYQAAQAGKELAKAQLAQAKQQLAYSSIYAPADGEVAMLYYRQGQMVPAGVPLIKLVNTVKMTARLKAPETDLQKVYLQQGVVAHFPAFPEEEFNGRIISIDKAIDPLTRTLELEVLLENGTDRLKSGLFGEFLLVTDNRENVIVLSDQAIMTRTKLRIDNDGKQITEKEYYVFLEKDGKAALQTITTGIHSRGRLEISEGLKFGDRIIVVGQNIVKDGDEVKIVN